MMRANYVIIGAGISGCSIAYNLAKRGAKDIVVFEKSFLTSGSTGRCGAGVRQQWATEMNCILAKASIDFFETAKETLDYEGDLEFKQDGYLIVAATKEEDEKFSENVKLQNSLGIPSRKLTKEEALEIVPHLDISKIISATFCPTDGHLNPFTTTDAFYKAAKRLGVKFYFNEEVVEIITENNKVKRVITKNYNIETENIINAAGGYSREVGLLAGIDIPVYSENHEILVTEPIEKIQGPMVMSFSRNIYCQQVPHGSFIMGRSDPEVLRDHSTNSTWKFLDEMAKTVCDILPIVGELRVIRQWGGSYNMSPDRQPIISKVNELEGFYIACGFSGHGFMFAPITGILLSEIILGLEPSFGVKDLSIERFKEKRDFVVEKSVV